MLWLHLSVVSGGEAASEKAQKFFTNEVLGGTIGAAPDNDWVLPDPQGRVADHHAALGFIHGHFYVAELAEAGVYLNDDKDPIGRGRSDYLRDGDRLTLGPYRIGVSVVRERAAESERQEAAPAPLPAERGRVAWTDWSLQSHAGPGRVQPMDTDSDEIDALLAMNRPGRSEAAAEAGPTQRQEADDLQRIAEELIRGARGEAPERREGGELVRVPPQEEVVQLSVAPIANGSAAEVVPPHASADALSAFWSGLGITPGWLAPDEEARLFARFGLALRAMADGLTDIYAAMREAPGGPRPQLAEGRREDANPFRSYRSGTDALLAAFAGTGARTPSIDQAAEACFDDLAARMAAVPEAVSDAMRRVLADADPKAIVGDRQHQPAGLFGAARQNARTLEEMNNRYRQFLASAQGRFQEAFEESFVRAYEEHCEWIRRHREGE